jgi:hypothetical protein
MDLVGLVGIFFQPAILLVACVFSLQRHLKTARLQ